MLLEAQLLGRACVAARRLEQRSASGTGGTEARRIQGWNEEVSHVGLDVYGCGLDEYVAFVG